MSKVIEYRVRPVTRYVVTRFYSDNDRSGGCEGCGEFDNISRANTVAEALHKTEEGSIVSKLVEPGFGHIGGDSADKFPLRHT